MAFANVFLGVREEARVAIKERLNWRESEQGEYTGPVTDREAKIFSYIADLDTTERIFKRPTIGGNVWTLWNVNFTERLSDVQQALTELLTDRPNHIAVLGAWKWTGEQFGTEHVFDTRQVDKWVSRLNPDYQPDPELPDYDPVRVLRTFETVDETYVSGYTGTPLYPIPVSQLLKFMPDVDGQPATVLADVNLLAGQTPRSLFP